MGTLRDLLRQRFDKVDPDGTEPALLRSVDLGAGTMAWYADARPASEAVWVELRWPGCAEIPNGAGGFGRAVAAMLNGYLAAELLRSASDDGAPTGATPRGPSLVLRAHPQEGGYAALFARYEVLHAQLAWLLAELVGGTDAFAALGRRDLVLAEQPSSEWDVPPSSPAAAVTAPVSAPPVSAGAPVGVTRARVWTARGARGEQVLRGALTSARWPARGSEAVRYAMARELERRFDVLATPGPISDPSLASDAAWVVVELTARRGTLEPDSVAAIAGLFDKWVSFVDSGLDWSVVLDLSSSTDASVVSRETRHGREADGAPREPGAVDTSGRRAAMVESGGGPEGGRESLGHEAGGLDLYLLDEGYDMRRVRQLISLLLSVDVIQAGELCEAVPALLLADISAARADQVRQLLRRAGGVVEVVASGSRPTRSTRGRTR